MIKSLGVKWSILCCCEGALMQGFVAVLRFVTVSVRFFDGSLRRYFAESLHFCKSALLQVAGLRFCRVAMLQGCDVVVVRCCRVAVLRGCSALKVC